MEEVGLAPSTSPTSFLQWLHWELLTQLLEPPTPIPEQEASPLSSVIWRTYWGADCGTERC